MKLGFAAKEITPPLGMELGGYAGYRPNSGVHDPLWCKALLLEQADGRYALIVLDLMCADESLCGKIAEAVAPLGIKKQCLIVSAIHSHAAPAGVIPGGGALSRINEAIVPKNPDFAAYMQNVVDAAAEACAEAAASLEKFQVRTGRSTMPPIGSERHTGAQAHGVLTVLEFRTESGKNLIFYNFPCHPTVLSAENLLVSADFAGQIGKHLAADLTVFANGAAGDISTRFTRREASFAECGRMGKLAAEYILAALDGKSFEDPQPLTGRYETLILPARRVETEEAAKKQLEEATLRWQQAVQAGADAGNVRILKSYVEGAGVNLEFARNMGGIRAFSVPVTVFKFAGFSFATVPGEFYSTLLPPAAAAICYANGYYRYITDEAAFDAGHYEALAAIVARGGGEILSNTIRQILENI
ncbi:MAG: neutral/alkaline non-lysosomal ceramidase N-terminal domain-containing protein [Oscillospiraceae bacterium]|nr:neutral/alkaline non-lysosomal ceramidase N-terminal domain-containing protein [Oscillospiraceae bacterium]